MSWALTVIISRIFLGLPTIQKILLPQINNFFMITFTVFFHMFVSFKSFEQLVQLG